MTTYSPNGVADIAALPIQERPRERLILNGPQVLSDHELLTVFLGAGSKHTNVSALALDVLRAVDVARSAPVASDLLKIRGIGGAKASQLCAALEFARRRLNPTKRRIQKPSDVLSAVGHFQDRPVEHFLALSLNGAHELITLRIVTIGLVNRTIVHPREVYADAIVDRATALVVCHNHPSGNLEPSEEDCSVTAQLKDAGEILGIKLLDHIIFSAGGYYSFLEDKKL